MVVSITSMRNPNSYPCILTNSNLFQPNAEVSTGCPVDAAICKSFFVEKTEAYSEPSHTSKMKLFP